MAKNNYYDDNQRNETINDRPNLIIQEMFYIIKWIRQLEDF